MLNPSTPQVLKALCVRTSLLVSNIPLATQRTFYHIPRPMCIPYILLLDFYPTPACVHASRKLLNFTTPSL